MDNRVLLISLTHLAQSSGAKAPGAACMPGNTQAHGEGSHVASIPHIVPLLDEGQQAVFIGEVLAHGGALGHDAHAAGAQLACGPCDQVTVQAGVGPLFCTVSICLSLTSAAWYASGM